MHDAQGYTQASWLIRIPVEAWELMAVIAICGNILIGYRAQKPKSAAFLMLVMPLIVSISFFLIADIDSPRAGMILAKPNNLMILSESLRAAPEQLH